MNLGDERVRYVLFAHRTSEIATYTYTAYAAGAIGMVFAIVKWVMIGSIHRYQGVRAAHNGINNGRGVRVTANGFVGGARAFFLHSVTYRRASAVAVYHRITPSLFAAIFNVNRGGHSI